MGRVLKARQGLAAHQVGLNRQFPAAEFGGIDLRSHPPVARAGPQGSDRQRQRHRHQQGQPQPQGGEAGQPHQHQAGQGHGNRIVEGIDHG
jgi:hypothetical protein